MVAIPLGLQSYAREKGNQPPTRLVNLYLEKDESGASPDEYYRLQRPGFKRLASFGGAIRAIFQADGVLDSNNVIVSGDRVILFDGENTRAIGTVVNDGGSAKIAATFEKIGLVSGGKFYTFDGTTFSAVALPDDRVVIDVDVINSYFLLACPDGRFYWMKPGQKDFSGDEDALAFATAESLPDGLVGLRRVRDDIFLFGTRSIEVFEATGDADNEFQRAVGRVTDKGSLSADTIRLFDNSVVYVGDDGMVYRVSDVPQRISTFGIEEHIRLRAGDCSSFVFTSEGHKFYCLRIPGRGTFCYDAATQVWSEFATTGQSVWRPVTGLDTRFGALCGDSSGFLFRLDADTVTDDGAPITRLVTATIALPTRPVSASNLSIGVGCDDAAVFSVRWRDALDIDWTPFRQLEARAGSDVINTYRLGLCRGPYRTFEISTVSPTVVRISGAVANEAWSQ